MFRLIALELKRFNLRNHVRGVLLANILILTMGIFLIYLLKEKSMALPDLPPLELEAMDLIRLIIKATFMVWESVLIAVIIIEEFRNKTISLLFTYPISRRKIITAKLILILLVTLAFMVISEILQNLSVFGLSKIFNFISYEFHAGDVLNTAITIIAAVLMGMVPLYIGMIRKSTIATIVSSLGIVSIVTQGNAGGLISILPVSIALGTVGIFFTAIAVKKIVSNDLLV